MVKVLRVAVAFEDMVQVNEYMCGSEFLLHILRDGMEHTAEGGQAVPASLCRAQGAISFRQVS